MKDWTASKNDFEAVVAQPGVSLESQTCGLFAVPEPLVAIEPLHRVVEALKIAFEEGDKASEVYGGTPGDLISMIVQRGPSEWASYVTAIAPLYIQHGVAEKLGRGIALSIQLLDEGEFSVTQLDLWYLAWEGFGQDTDELQIPLLCLRAAIEVLKSDPPSDRPLFSLPLEIRELVRPLLKGLAEIEGDERFHVLFTQYTDARNRYVKEGLMAAMAAVAEGHFDQANLILLQKVNPTYQEAADLARQLQDALNKAALDEFKASEHRYTQIRMLSIGGIVFALLVVALATIIAVMAVAGYYHGVF